jgi:hypothetical protein
MKTFNVIRKIWVLLLIVPVIFIAGCSKKFDSPPLEIPKFIMPDGGTLISIKALNARHTGLGTLDSINDNIVVTGIVVSSDETGNIYKSLYIEDTSGGLLISLDATSLYTSYRLGQRIYVKCKGLFMGDYGGMTQLGAVYNGGIGRIAAPLIDKYVFLDSLPGHIPAAKLITLPITNYNYMGMLVKLENVHFQDVASTFSDPGASSNRNILDSANNILIMRNSNYATFATKLIPDGTGTIYGILGLFGSDPQLYIRDLNDLVGFDYSTALILNESFSATGSLGTFSQYSVAGVDVWAQSSYSGSTFAKISGFASSTANEDWLISPSLNLNNYTGEKLNFFSMMKFGAAGDGSLKVYYSTNYTSGDPTTSNWTELTGFNLSTGNYTSTPSGDIDLSGVVGTNVHIAFKYSCGTTNIATWELGGIMIKGTHI